MSKSKKIKKLFYFAFFVVFVGGLVYIAMNYSIYKTNENFSVNGKTNLLISKSTIIKKYDIVLFDEPYLNENKETLSRCLATGGDVLEISYSKVIVNQDTVQENFETTHKYRVNCFTEQSNNQLINDYKLTDSLNILGVYYLNLTQQQADVLIKDSSIMIKQIIAEKDLSNDVIFPFSYKFRWNEDNFGPLTVPAKGFKIEMNEKNYTLYKNTINYFEQDKVSFKDGKYYVNDNESNEYIFKNDYVFILNDDRTNINDSRKWGLIPTKIIKGKVIKQW